MKPLDGLDAFDRKILSILAVDGRISWSELADRVSLSQTPTVRRVRALESQGYISGYQAVIDEERLGQSISVFVSVSLDMQTDDALALFEERVSAMPEVMSCFMTTGSFDYLLRVLVSDLKAYHMFISSLTKIPSVSRVMSSFAVKSVIQRPMPPLPLR